MIVLTEVTRVIDFIASFRFAMEDEKCLGFHLSGFIGNSKELPKEIQEAKQFEDLTEMQRKYLAESVGVSYR